MIGRRLEGWTRLAWLVGLSLVLGACAAPPVEPLPAHPFPRWVAGLEPGSTDVDDVISRFGDPEIVEESVRGGTVWHYRFPEIHWSDDDPMRPSVAADGTLAPPGPSPHRSFLFRMASVNRFLDRLFAYPPTQPRAPQRRKLPATIHVLELRFATNGLLRNVRYQAEPGATWVPAAH